MEHELFQSKLKSSIDAILISGIIRSSSSSLNSHRTAAMELILQRTIWDRRERMFGKAKNSVRPDPTPQPKRASEVPSIPTSEVQPAPPALAPRSPSQPPLNDSSTGNATSLAPVSVKYEALPNSSVPSKPAKKIKEEPPVYVNPNPSPSADFLELICPRCNAKQPRRDLWLNAYCSLCPRLKEGWTRVKCVGCGARADNVNACTGCHGKFK